MSEYKYNDMKDREIGRSIERLKRDLGIYRKMIGRD